jgi:predicted DNA-binding transcriptional regulator AlpA
MRSETKSRTPERAPTGSLPELLTVLQAADRLRLSPATLQRHRTRGTGPKYVKLGRRIAYRGIDLEDWVGNRLATSTADARVRGLST